MLKFDMTEMDSNVYHCVNPYEITPKRETGQCTLNVNQEPTETQTNIGVRSKQTEKNIKLEMETFGDLAPFLHSTSSSPKSNPVDELNTPIFDRKGPFNFMTNNSTQNIASQLSTTSEDNLKFEFDIFDNSVFSNIKHLQNNSDISVINNNLNIMNVHPQENNSAVINNILQCSKANYVSPPSESDYGDMFIFNNNNNNNETPINIQLNADQIISNNNNNHNNNKYGYVFEDNSSIVSVNSNVSSPNSDVRQESIGTAQIEETSNTSCTSSEISVQKLPKLKLNFGLEFSQALNIPNTPDVINSLVSFESDKFNILDFTDEKNITTINVEDLHFEIPTTSSSLLEDNENNNNTNTSLKRKRKIRKRYEDDDEDYSPPSEIPYNNSDESDNEYEITNKGKRSKRTAKRSLSLSSDDAVKYRELRDKNNEASRKSRLKRKSKETELVKEMEELEEKNIKLKAQVEELDKMVGNFRNNLFKIMLKK